MWLKTSKQKSQQQKFFLTAFSLLYFFFISFSSHADSLSCEHLYIIQSRFLSSHIIYSEDSLQQSKSKKLEKRVVNKMIKFLDPDKIYFLASDVKKIQKKSSNLFKNFKNKNCQSLYSIYNLYKLRLEQQTQMASKYLNKNFKLNPKARFILDRDKKSFPTSKKQANKNMKNYLQYQVANVFKIEKDLKKSVRQVAYIVKNKPKQIRSWKPFLTRKEIRKCQQESKDKFQVCKPGKWYSFYLNAFAESLDAHSSYLDKEAIEDFHISMNLSLEGIGATLGSRFGYTVVEHLVPGGAAFKSKKLQKKDKILAVGQTRKKMIDIFGENISDVVSLIRGKKGTSVYLKILREVQKKNKKKASSKKANNKKTKQEFIIKLVRGKVELQEDAASLVFITIKNKNKKSYKVAVLKVPSFYGSGYYGKSVTRDVRKLLQKAKSAKAEALVLDLSNNRGGSLEESVNLAGLFFAQGNVVKQSEKKQTLISQFLQKNQITIPSEKNISYSALKDENPFTDYNGPLVVLVNRFSASASEIVSGALQDYKRAVIVGGDHTFGKGSVQSVVPLSLQLGAIKTTVGLYFIPSGRSTQKNGVLSDIPLPSILNIDEIGEKTLDYALDAKIIPDFKSSDNLIFSNSPRQIWKPINYKIIKKLKSLSKKRVAKNHKFTKITKKLNKIKRRLEKQKSITIAEVLKVKEDDEKLNGAADEDFLDSKVKLKKYLERADIQEAANIVADLASAS